MPAIYFPVGSHHVAHGRRLLFFDQPGDEIVGYAYFSIIKSQNYLFGFVEATLLSVQLCKLHGVSLPG